MKIKLTVIGMREWTSKPLDGSEPVTCYFYQGFDEKNKPMEFKSQAENYQVNETLKYEAELAEEFDLKAVFDSFKGKIKFVDISEEGKVEEK